MIANRATIWLGLVLSYLSIPLQIVTHVAGGCLISLTLGLLLLPLSLLWMVVFLGPLIALSWLWSITARLGAASALLQIPIALIGVPLAALGILYVDLVPEPEKDSLRQKLLICQTFPFTLDFLREQRYTDHARNAPRTAESAEFSAAFSQLSTLRFDDPVRADVYARLYELHSVALRPWGLTHQTYDRVTNIVAELDGYGRYRWRDGQ